MSRKECKQLKIDIQEYQKEKYPELSHSVVDYNRGYRERYEIPFTPAIETYEYMVQQIVKRLESFAELIAKLKKYGFEVYYRWGDFE